MKGIIVDPTNATLVAAVANVIGKSKNIKIINQENYKTKSAKELLAYCSVNGYMPYMGSPRRRDNLPQEQQLRKIALAQQKRERKAIKKENNK